MRNLDLRIAYYLCFILGLAVLSASCSDESPLPGVIDDNIDPNRKILMTFQMPKASTPSNIATKSISEIDENEIRTIDVLAFKKDNGGNWAYSYKAVGENISVAPDADATANKKQFSVKVTKEAFQQVFVLIINARNEINALDWDALANKEKNELLEMLIFENAERWEAKLSDSADPSKFTPFPMWGESVPQVISESTNSNNGTIKVLRAIARVDVIAETVKSDFELTDVHIYNTKTRGYIVPDPVNIDANVTAIKALAPNATATMPHNDYISADDPKSLKYKVTASTKLERAIYLLESPAVSDKESTQVTDAERYQTTCLVIGGKYKGGETTWYRVDLFKEVKDSKGEITSQKYADFLRNHSYRFNISAVSGPGHPDPETAFKNKTINMVTEVKVWDDGQVGDIIFDGQHYLSVYPGINMTFSKEAASRVDTIKTDVPAGFKITGITYEEGGSKDWITIDKSLNTALGTGETPVPLNISVTQNPDGKDRIGYIHLEAGRMHVKITVTQNNKTANLFEFISLENINGQGLAIPRAGGAIKATVNANIPWKLKGKRGENEEETLFTPDGSGNIQTANLTINIDPLTRFWKDEQEMETDINIWVEYELEGKTVKVQQTTYYQVPYDISIISPLLNTINKYGEFVELKFKGYYPDLPFRVIDDKGNIASDVVIVPEAGDIVNREKESSIKVLVYSNYSGNARELTLQYERPILVNGVEQKEWKNIHTATQEYNGLTLPEDGYQATRGVLGIGAKTGKLRLDGSHGFYGGTASYIDINGIEQREDVFMVAFKWGSIIALKAPKLNASKDIINISENGVAQANQKLTDIIAWVPPGFQGDITNLDSNATMPIAYENTNYNAIPAYLPYTIPYIELSAMDSDLAKKGYGDPCRLALSENNKNFDSSYRMPFGWGDMHEEYDYDRSANPELQTTGDGQGYYYFLNKYYTEPSRQYTPAHGIIYEQHVDMLQDENGDPVQDENGEYIFTETTLYRADYVGRAGRRGNMAFWTSHSVADSHSAANGSDKAYTFRRLAGGDDGMTRELELSKNIALPIRCIK